MTKYFSLWKHLFHMWQNLFHLWIFFSIYYQKKIVSDKIWQILFRQNKFNSWKTSWKGITNLFLSNQDRRKNCMIYTRRIYHAICNLVGPICMFKIYIYFRAKIWENIFFFLCWIIQYWMGLKLIKFSIYNCYECILIKLINCIWF